MIKIFKKAVSALLASIMCIPTGIIGTAGAAETEGAAATTVTLTDTENGIMQFSEECMENSTADQNGYHMLQVNESGDMEQVENDGSVWAFNRGDAVEIELIPDGEYSVESFTIKAADTGDTMAQKKTTDNVFSFVMPEKSVTVEAVFTNGTSVEIVPEDELAESGKLDVSSRYHDITESDEVTKEEVDEVIADLATESYIKANLDKKYITVGDKFSIENILLIKNTLFDGRYVEENDTIDSIMESIEYGTGDYEKNILKVMGLLQSYVYVYDFNADSDYYVAYADTMHKDSDYEVQDWEFATNDTGGNTLDGCVYDNDTGLLYIPKHLYNDINEKEGEDTVCLLSLQAQFMQVYKGAGTEEPETDDDMPDMESTVHTVNMDEENETVEVESDSQDIFSLETAATVDAGMDPEKLNVLVNGVPVSDDAYAYDPKTGELVVNASSSSVISIEATEDDITLADHITSLTAEEAKATEKSVTFDDMGSIRSAGSKNPVAVKDYKTNIPKEGERLHLITTNMEYHGESAPHKTNEDNAAYVDTKGEKLAEWINSSKKTFPYSLKKGGYELYSFLVDLKNCTARDGTPKSVCGKKGTYTKILNKVHAWLPCNHISASLSADGKPMKDVWDKAPVDMKVVKVKTTKDTATYKKGYIVFAILTPQTCTQTGCGIVRMWWEWTGKEKNDPLGLSIYKAPADGKLPADATLSGAEFTCKFYEGKNRKTVSAVKKETPTATWTFRTKDIDTAGSQAFTDAGEAVGDKYNPEGEVDNCGLQIFPTNLGSAKDRNEYRNSFLIGHTKDDVIANYRKHIMKTGTYYIYESKAPTGFLNAGEMLSTDTSAKIAPAEPDNGMVVYYNAELPGFWINGTKVDSQDLEVNNDSAAVMVIKETPDSPGMESDAVFTDTGKQVYELGPDGTGTARIRDTIIIHADSKKQGKYEIYTSLYDVTAKKYLSVDWDSAFGTVIGENENMGEDGAGNTYGYTSILSIYDSEQMPPDKDGTHTVTVEGNLTLDGLAGHTLVFMNRMQFYAKSSEAEDEDAEADDEYGNDVEGDGYDLSFSMKSDENDPRETLKVKGTIDEDNPRSSSETELLSSETGRKAPGGETIIYAGRYKDTSLQEKGDQVLQTLTDTIKYNNLLKNHKYLVRGYLMDADTGEVAVDADGRKINNLESTVIQTSSATGSGEWKIKFTFDPTGCGGMKYVSFVDIYDGKDLVKSFRNINDSNESVLIPSIKTKLTDSRTGTKIAYAGNTIRLTDTITYSRLMPGARYKVKTTLVDMATGKTAKDASGSDIVREQVISGAVYGESGSFNVNISFDTDPEDTGIGRKMNPERKRRGPVKRLSTGNRMVCGIISNVGHQSEIDGREHLFYCCTYGTISL